MNIRIIGVLLILFSISSSAQMAKNALGLRFSGSSEIQSVGVEVSYQQNFSDLNRIEADLGFTNSTAVDVFRLAAFYHWVYPLEEGFRWYVGPGGGIGAIDYNTPAPSESNSSVFLILGGQGGIEYVFDEIPLQLSLDLRPEFFIGNLDDNLGIDLGLSARYLF